MVKGFFLSIPNDTFNVMSIGLGSGYENTDKLQEGRVLEKLPK